MGDTAYKRSVAAVRPPTRASPPSIQAFFIPQAPLHLCIINAGCCGYWWFPCGIQRLLSQRRTLLRRPVQRTRGIEFGVHGAWVLNINRVPCPLCRLSRTCAVWQIRSRRNCSTSGFLRRVLQRLRSFTRIERSHRLVLPRPTPVLPPWPVICKPRVSLDSHCNLPTDQFRVCSHLWIASRRE